MQTMWKAKCPWQLMKELSQGRWPYWPSVGNPEVSTACEPVIAFPKMLINTHCVKKEIPPSGLSMQNPSRAGARGAVIHCRSSGHTASPAPVTRPEDAARRGLRTRLADGSLLLSPTAFPGGPLASNGEQASGIPSLMPPPPGIEGKFRETTWQPRCSFFLTWATEAGIWGI